MSKIKLYFEKQEERLVKKVFSIECQINNLEDDLYKKEKYLRELNKLHRITRGELIDLRASQSTVNTEKRK